MSTEDRSKRDIVEALRTSQSLNGVAEQRIADLERQLAETQKRELSLIRMIQDIHNAHQPVYKGGEFDELTVPIKFMSENWTAFEKLVALAAPEPA